MPQELAKLPGAEIVLPGIEDLKAGRETVNPLAVSAAARKLGVRELIGEDDTEEPAAHRLYLRLNDELGDAAHSHYNAILARVVSFARAAERLGVTPNKPLAGISQPAGA
jgi:hypothetical protein